MPRVQAQRLAGCVIDKQDPLNLASCQLFGIDVAAFQANESGGSRQGPDITPFHWHRFACCLPPHGHFSPKRGVVDRSSSYDTRIPAV